MIIWFFTLVYAAMMVVTALVMYRYTQKQYVICKMITATLFLVIALLAYNRAPMEIFFYLMPGFCFCWGGDLFLALAHEIDNKLRNPQFIIGVISFTIGQIIIAFALLTALGWHISWTIIIPFIVLGYTICCTKSKDYEFGINAIPCSIYGFFVGLSAALGLQLILQNPGSTPALFLGIGTILFLISDAVLSMKLFWKKDVPWSGAGVIAFYFGAMWFLTSAICM